MESTERSRGIVVRVIDRMNQDFPEEPGIENSPATILYGPGGRLDSLGLVDLVFRIQEAVRDEYGIAIAVADENVLSAAESPFRTVESLIANTAKAKRVLKWKPKILFKDLAKIMVDADMRRAGLKPIGRGDKILRERFKNKWWKGD